MVFKALSDETRIRILKLLEKRELCVCELTEILGSAQSTVSRHLRILKDAGLVDDMRDGLWVNYRLSKEEVNHYAEDILRLISTWLNEDPKVTKDLNKAETIDREDICARTLR